MLLAIVESAGPRIRNYAADRRLRPVRTWNRQPPTTGTANRAGGVRPPDAPRIVALVIAINQAVFAIFGTLRDLAGIYAVPFLVVAIVQLAAGAAVLVGRFRVR